MSQTSTLNASVQIGDLVGRRISGASFDVSLSSRYPHLAARHASAIHTLGPALTSSHLAAQALVQRAGAELEIVLHNTFDEIHALRPRSDVGALALVPSAYANANHFFMSPRAVLVGCFCSDTPPYHLAWPGTAGDPLQNPGREIHIASHPAPIGLLPRLLPKDARYRLSLYHSTVLSARAARKGETDAALCNLDTIKAFGLRHARAGITISMTWNLFALND